MSTPVIEPPYNSGRTTHDHLREVCLQHLNLIHKMSETILAKDRQIKLLKENNQQLLLRLSLLEKLQNPEPVPTPEPSESSSVEASNEEGIRKRRRGRPSTKDKSVGTGPSQPQVNKAVQAKTDSVPSENGVNDSDDDDDDEYLTTSEPYFTLLGEDFIQEEKQHIVEIRSHAEVPGWRVVPISPTYTMEGTEDIEDETFLRRHQKFELDEKRRKRWDIQRMREQRHVEKLRARYDDSTGVGNILNGNANNVNVLACLSNLQTLRPEKSLLPHPDQVTHIMVTDELPVTAFGQRVPKLEEEEFSLPWI